ncbi:MAG TPA: hypothetical protein VEK07_21470 [Polyangiaceae bacterium]|nr:hypothetical protein [Polyangiaceae bacterium]
MALAITGASLVGTSPVCADEGLRLGIQWDKLGEVIRTGGESLLPEIGFKLGRSESTSADYPVPPRQSGPGPRVSLVARDWSGAGVLVGRPSPTDLIRLSHSSRMLVTRVRATEGALVPFVQAGLGQWRIDTDLLPAFRPDVELAAQPGAGFEARLSPFVVIAVETDYTILYRQEHEPQMVCRPRFWGSFLAARGHF